MHMVCVRRVGILIHRPMRACVSMFFLLFNASSCRRVFVSCQYIRHVEQHHLLGVQSRYILPGRHGHAIALPRRLLLPGCRRDLGCAAPRVSRGVVLQCQRDGRRRALSSRVHLSVRGPVVGAGALPDRFASSVSHFQTRVAFVMLWSDANGHQGTILRQTALVRHMQSHRFLRCRMRTMLCFERLRTNHTGSACPTAGLIDGVSCPRGQYCPVLGLVSGLPCPWGRFNPLLGMNTSMACVPCASGLLASPDNAACVPVCPVGSHLNATAAQCVLCSGGVFCLGGVNPALPCPAGTQPRIAWAWAGRARGDGIWRA
jgi:hypothetical protein